MSDTDSERERANYMLDPHRPLDPKVPNSPSSQLVTDAHGRIVGANHDEHAELVPDSTRPQKSVEGFRPGDAAIRANANDVQ
jgi:hypothetical protein